MNRLAIGIAIVLVIVIVGAFVVLNNRTGAPSSGVYTTAQVSGQTTAPYASYGTVRTPVMMTDPPHLPAGTQAMVMAYSSVMVHSSGTAGSGWVNATGHGSVNLLAVVNSSQVIGFANVTANSTINLARFTVTSATITINGTTYNVSLPTNNVTVAVTGGTKINQSTGVLIDFAPTVTAVYNQNTTGFVMAPAARATVVANASASVNANIGVTVGLSARSRTELEASAPNITISSASVSVSGNVTTVSLTVVDNSNSSVVLNSVLVNGQETVVAAPSVGLNVSIGSGGVLGNGVASKGSTNAQYKSLVALGLNIVAFNTLGFVVNSNGSLSVPSSEADVRSSGYVLGPGASATMTYNGIVAYNSGTLYSTPEVGSQYTVTVTGQGGASASTRITAT